MKKKPLIKFTTILIVLTLILSYIPSFGSFAPNKVVAEELDLNTDVEENLSEEVLSSEFDLEEAVEEMPSVDEMTKEEKALFDQILAEQVELHGDNQEEVFEEVLTDFFDESSEISGDLEKVQEVILEDESVNSMNVSSMSIISTSFLAASSVKVRLANKYVGAAINVAIGFAIGGGTAAIQSYIVKKGKKEAQKVFTKTVKSRLIAWGAPKLAASVGVAVAYAMEFLDFGYYVAKRIDKLDKRPGNGYVDLY